MDRFNKQTRKVGTGGKNKPDPNPKRRDRRCNRCNQLGQIASNRPSLYVCNNWGVGGPKEQVYIYKMTRVNCKGKVEGAPVDDVTLDTGSTRNIINSKLVPNSVDIMGRVPISGHVVTCKSIP